VQNSTEDAARLRSFTHETIPFKQVAHQSNAAECINLQEILVDAFQLMKNFVFYQKRCSHAAPNLGPSTIE